MGKNKKITYLLIALVVIIWGVIIYKFYAAVTTKQADKQHIYENVQHQVNDTLRNYELFFYDRDPFLSILSDTATILQKDTELARPVVKIPKEVPAITYCGMIENMEQKTVILKWNNKFYHVQLGNKQGALELKAIYKDFILIAVNGEKVKVPITDGKKKNNNNENNR